MKKTLLLTLFLSFWLHAERNGFYLDSDILGGSYVQATANTNEFNPNNLLNNPYAQYYPPTSSFPSNPSNSNNVSLPGGSGGLFSEISFGYKYFLVKKGL
ncbi:hypothetical protein Taiwan63_07180 [Helicobacter pylori]